MREDQDRVRQVHIIHGRISAWLSATNTGRLGSSGASAMHTQTIHGTGLFTYIGGGSGVNVGIMKLARSRNRSSFDQFTVVGMGT